MQFLKTLFWVALAIILVLFGSVNWTSVTVRLWGGLEADVKLPALVLAAFLLGFVPMLIVHVVRSWGLKRRLDALERQVAATGRAPVPAARPTEPNRAPIALEDRIATDQKVWPA